jgi:hypothetical protein
MLVCRLSIGRWRILFAVAQIVTGLSAPLHSTVPMANKTRIFDFVRCRFQARRQMGNVKNAEMQTNQVKENWHAID